jgi:hypothetical protein
MINGEQRRFEGLERGHQMASLAADRAGEDWKAIALEAFRLHAKKHQKFTTEEVRAAFPDLPSPPDMRAWGQVALLARREGYVIGSGWIRAESRKVHGMVVTHWQSKICY